MNAPELLQRYADADARVAQCNAALKEANADLAAARDAVMAYMDEQGTERLEAAGLSVSISHSEVPQVVDWELAYRYIHRHKAFHLLERRMSTKAWRELVETTGSELPGVKGFTKISLNVSRSKR